MLLYIAKRILLMFVVIIGATLLVFTILQLAPGDPAEVIAIARYKGIENVTYEEVESIRHLEGLNEPLFIQYGKWLGHTIRGDLGRSLIDGVSVSEEILRLFPATLQLALASMLISLLIAMPIGILSAVKQNSAIDHLGMTGAMLGVSMPNFWLGLLLILVFSVRLGWLPVYSREGLDSLILPALTLGTGIAAMTTRMTRSSMLEVLGQNYIRTAHAKGLSKGVVISKHALKNAIIPIITIMSLQFAFLLEGSVIVETIFAWPGIGKMLIDAIHNRDFATIQGCVLFIAVIFTVLNLVVDICYVWLNPRIRYGKRAT